MRFIIRPEFTFVFKLLMNTIDGSVSRTLWSPLKSAPARTYMEWLLHPVHGRIRRGLHRVNQGVFETSK